LGTETEWVWLPGALEGQVLAGVQRATVVTATASPARSDGCRR